MCFQTERIEEEQRKQANLQQTEQTKTTVPAPEYVIEVSETDPCAEHATK